VALIVIPLYTAIASATGQTPGEKIREQVLQIDPEEAYATLRRQRATQRLDTVTPNVDLGAVKKRACITTPHFLGAALKVILDNKEYCH